MNAITNHIQIAEVWIWIRSQAPYLADYATYGLAVVGVLVAVKPPEKEAFTRWIYIGLVAVLALIGVTANKWQRNIEASKEEKSKAEQNEASKRSSEDLRTIVNFVQNSPKQLTKKDISDFAKVLAENHDNQVKPPSVVSDDSLHAMADELIYRMTVKLQDFVAEREHLYTRIHSPANTHPNVSSLDQVAIAEEQLKYDFLADYHIVPEATAIRDLMIKRFGPDQKTNLLSKLIEETKNPTYQGH